MAARDITVMDNLRTIAKRTSLSPASLRTVDALNGRRRLSPSPSRSPAPVITGSHLEYSVTSSRSTSKYEIQSESEERISRQSRLQTGYQQLANSESTHESRSRTLTGTHGDISCSTGYDIGATQAQRLRVMYEARNKELEDELASEKCTRLKTERQRSELKAELSVLNERLEAAQTANQLQVEITRKRDVEIQKLQNEVDELHAQHDVQLGVYRKKHQESIKHMTEQIDRLHSSRQKSDRERLQFRVEVEELNLQIDQLTKAKIAAEKSSRHLEAEVSQLNVKLTELQREYNDVIAVRNRLQQELSNINPRVTDLENQLVVANRAKLALSKQVDDYRRADDDESTVRSRLSAENLSLQELLEQTREQLNDEREARIDLQRQLSKAQNDAASWRQKYETGENAINPDMEEIKKRLTARLSESEDRLSNAQGKLSALEKVHSTLQQETESMVAEIDKYQQTNVQQEKRLRLNEKLMEEWQIKVNELTPKLESSQIEVRKLSSEVTQLKTQLDEAKEQNTALRREHTTLAGESRELKEQLRLLKQSSSEYQKTSQRIEAEKESLQGTVEAMESSLQQKEVKIERALNDLIGIRQEMDKRISEKDEELQDVRKIHQRALDTLQTNLDTESKNRMEAVLVKKRLEQDINELELTLDSVNRAKAEAEKNWKQCQQELSDLEELLDEEQRTKRTNREEWTLMERKNNTLTTEVQDLRSQLEVHEKTRKIVEEELRQVSNRVTELTAANNLLSITKKKLETDLRNLTNELDDRMSELKQTSEQNRKLMSDTSQLTEELRVQEQTNIQTEKQRRLLETQTKELQARLEEIETHSVLALRKTIEKLEQKVQDLEIELANEQRRHGECQKTMRRNERRLAEINEQMDMDIKTKEREQELVDRLQHKLKQYKRQLDEAEEIAAVNLARYRKLQLDLEEAESRTKLAEKSLNQQRAINRSSLTTEETMTQPQPGVTIRKTTTRTQYVSSESRSEQKNNESHYVSSASSAGSKSQMTIEKD